MPAASTEFGLTTRGLTADEIERLHGGMTVVRRETVERNGHHYVGGITYAIVDASPEELARVFDDVKAYRHLLPKTKAVTVVGENNGDRYVELRQGNAVLEAAYTIRIHRDPAKSEVRFWLDPSRPHGIEDAWGFFRTAPIPASPGDAAIAAAEAMRPGGQPRTLLTFGILVDMGPGIVRDLFEDRLCAITLTVPDLVRRYVATSVVPHRRRPG
jgi:hypothetical protein